MQANSILHIYDYKKKKKMLQMCMNGRTIKGHEKCSRDTTQQLIPFVQLVFFPQLLKTIDLMPNKKLNWVHAIPTQVCIYMNS